MVLDHEDRRGLGVVVLLHLHAARARVVAHQPQGVLDHGLHGDQRGLVAPAAGEVDQLAQDAAQAGHLLAHGGDDRRVLALQAPLVEQLQLHLDRRERVAQVVGHAGGQQAEGRHLLLVQQARLQLLLLGDHALHQEHVVVAARHLQRVGLDAHDLARARVGVHQLAAGGRGAGQAVGHLAGRAGGLAAGQGQVAGHALQVAAVHALGRAVGAHDAEVAVEHHQAGRGLVHHDLEQRLHVALLARALLEVRGQLAGLAGAVALGHVAHGRGRQHAGQPAARVVQVDPQLLVADLSLEALPEGEHHGGGEAAGQSQARDLAGRGAAGRDRGAELMVA